MPFSNWMERVGLRPSRVTQREAQQLQIGQVSGNLTVITSGVGHVPSIENCRACPVRCCSHRVLAHDTWMGELDLN